MRPGPGPHQRIYKRPDGELIDVLVPRDQGQFPGGQGNMGQVIVYLPVVDEHGEKITSPVIWDRVPDDWTLEETTEDDPAASEPPTPTIEPIGPEVAYDPADHNVEDVIEYVATEVDNVGAIDVLIALETGGKGRSTLIEALEARKAELESADVTGGAV